MKRSLNHWFKQFFTSLVSNNNTPWDRLCTKLYVLEEKERVRGTCCSNNIIPGKLGGVQKVSRFVNVPSEKSFLFMQTTVPGHFC